MSPSFTSLCTLFENLSRTQTVARRQQELGAWFKDHVQREELQADTALALLSSLLPGLRLDRVYGVQEKRLHTLVVQTWCLGPTRARELQLLQDIDGHDFASSVQISLGLADQLSDHALTVMDVDQALSCVAASYRFSSADLRGAYATDRKDAKGDLQHCLRQMNGLEAKWMMRLLLKDLQPANVPQQEVMQLVHPALYQAFQVQHCLSQALKLVYASQDHASKPALCKPDQKIKFAPQVGTMIALPRFEKARSVRHCTQLVGPHVISAERKYDGEYCQLHIQVDEWGHSQIKIFSKSGRDSTLDRAGIHDNVGLSLRIGGPACKFRSHCVMVGEIVVWSDNKQDIMPFHTIRNHVTREGFRLGCKHDAPPPADEHLMLVLYDLLLLDGVSLIHEAYQSRRIKLQDLVDHLPGLVEVGHQQILNLKRSSSQQTLAGLFSHAVKQHWEGLVLKRCSDPYASALDNACFIKLKKDYIPGLGDTADLLVIGGRRRPRDLHQLHNKCLEWTVFYLACLDDRESESDRELVYTIVGTVSRPCISAQDLSALDAYGRLSSIPWSEYEPSVKTLLGKTNHPTHIFARPAVVEVIGAGFDIPPNASFYTLRFLRIIKIHTDRAVTDAVSMDQYQELAVASRQGDDDGEEVGETQTTECSDERSKSQPTDTASECSEIARERENLGSTRKRRPDRDFYDEDAKPSKITKII